MGDNENYVSRLFQYCNYSFIPSIIGSFLKDDTSDPCFESIQLKTTHVSVIAFFNTIYINYYLIAVRQYFAIVAE